MRVTCVYAAERGPRCPNWVQAGHPFGLTDRYAPPGHSIHIPFQILQRPLPPACRSPRLRPESLGPADPAKALGLVDILDGRLLAQIAQFADRPQADLGLPADALAKAEAAWSLLSSDALLPLTKVCARAMRQCPLSPGKY